MSFFNQLSLYKIWKAYAENFSTYRVTMKALHSQRLMDPKIYRFFCIKYKRFMLKTIVVDPDYNFRRRRIDWIDYFPLFFAADQRERITIGYDAVSSYETSQSEVNSAHIDWFNSASHFLHYTTEWICCFCFLCLLHVQQTQKTDTKSALRLHSVVSSWLPIEFIPSLSDTVVACMRSIWLVNIQNVLPIPELPFLETMVQILSET